MYMYMYHRHERLIMLPCRVIHHRGKFRRNRECRCACIIETRGTCYLVPIHPKLERQRQGKDRARPGREVRLQRHKIHQKFIYLSMSQTALTDNPSELE